MSPDQGGKRPRPPAKSTAKAAAKPTAAAKPGARASAKPRGGDTAKPKPKRRRAKKRRDTLLSRLSGVSRLTWLAGLCLVLLGVLVAWWWGSLPPQRPAPPASSAPPPVQVPPPTVKAPVPPSSSAQAQASAARATIPTATTNTAHPSTSTASSSTTISSTTTTTAPPPPARRQVQAMPLPPYEEPQEGATPQAQLQAVDEAIFAALRRGGLEPEQIHIHVSPTAVGDVTLLEARLRPGQETRPLAQTLDKALAATSAKTAWQDLPRHKEQPGGRLMQVRLAGHVTHRLSLLSPGLASLPTPPGPPVTVPPPPLPPGARPRVALVIDDMGYHLEAAKRLMALDLHVTLSILPFAPHARETAELARRQGTLVIAHLPMEPRTYPSLSPGPGALLVSQDQEALARLTRQALAVLPGVAGANNHMGSRFTKDSAALRPVLEVLRTQGLFFLDSMTSPRSQARDLARRMGLANAQRDVFLDHEPTTGAITQQVLRLIMVAKAQGQAIAIGHPHATTIAVLTSLAPRLKQEVELVPVSQLLTPPGQGELDSRGAKP